MSASGHLAKLKDLAVSETGFIFDPHTGATYTTNGSGVAILRGLQEGLDRDAVIARLRGGFEVAEADLDRDIDEFIQILRENALVPRGFALDYTVSAASGAKG